MQFYYTISILYNDNTILTSYIFPGFWSSLPTHICSCDCHFEHNSLHLRISEMPGCCACRYLSWLIYARVWCYIDSVVIKIKLFQVSWWLPRNCDIKWFIRIVKFHWEILWLVWFSCMWMKHSCTVHEEKEGYSKPNHEWNSKTKWSRRIMDGHNNYKFQAVLLYPSISIVSVVRLVLVSVCFLLAYVRTYTGSWTFLVILQWQLKFDSLASQSRHLSCSLSIHWAAYSGKNRALAAWLHWSCCKYFESYFNWTSLMV